MKIIVLKFGELQWDPKKIAKVAKIITSYINKKYRVIVVSSAMSGVTNELLLKTKKFRKIFLMKKKM